MKKISIATRVKHLQMLSQWYSLLFWLTRSNRFFDKKVKVGILMLSLINLLASGKAPAVRCSTSPNVLPNRDSIKVNRERLLNTVLPSTDSIEEEGITCYMVVENTPMFPGGFDSLRTFVAKNLVYPSEAVKDRIMGTVIIEFTIDTEGKPVEPRVLRSICKELDEEAMRLFSIMPRWTVGTQAGKPVRVKYTMPVKFTLNDTIKRKDEESNTPSLH